MGKSNAKSRLLPIWHQFIYVLQSNQLHKQRARRTDMSIDCPAAVLAWHKYYRIPICAFHLKQLTSKTLEFLVKTAVHLLLWRWIESNRADALDLEQLHWYNPPTDFANNNQSHQPNRGYESTTATVSHYQTKHPTPNEKVMIREQRHPLYLLSLIHIWRCRRRG